MGLKILHSADWHLDSPFASLDDPRRKLLRRSLSRIPAKVVELVQREQCDMVLLAGDIFDGPCSPGSLKLVQQALEECRVPVFIAPGNHDFCGPDSPWLTEIWPENVHIFTGKMQFVDVPELSCRVYGAGYTSMDCAGLLEGFHASGDQKYSLAVLHGDPTQASSPYCPVTAGQVRSSELDYLALGHIHKAGMFRAGATLCAWPGCPMGRGWDETGDKGVYIVTLEDTARVQFLPLDTLRFHETEVCVGEDAAAALEAVLPMASTDDFYRITLTGNGEPDLDRLIAHFSHIPNLELRDRCVEAVDIWAQTGEDTLRGVFFRMLREEMDAADPESAGIIRLAAEISHTLLEGREVELP